MGDLYDDMAEAAGYSSSNYSRPASGQEAIQQDPNTQAKAETEAQHAAQNLRAAKDAGLSTAMAQEEVDRTALNLRNQRASDLASALAGQRPDQPPPPMPFSMDGLVGRPMIFGGGGGSLRGLGAGLGGMMMGGGGSTEALLNQLENYRLNLIRQYMQMFGGGM